MSLPKLQVQTSRMKSRDGTTTYTLRPFSAKEQKILLVAKEAIKNEDSDTVRAGIMLDALEQVIDNCLVDKSISTVPAYDFPFIMLELRKMSVDNITPLTYRCTSLKDGAECGNQFTVNVDLGKINTKGEMKPTKESRTIKLDDNFGVMMKYPTFSEFKSIYLEKGNDIQALRLFMDFVFELNGDGIYPIAESTNEELEDFITDAGPKVKLIQDWIESMPKPYFKMEYVCKSCGSTKVIELKDLSDFF